MSSLGHVYIIEDEPDIADALAVFLESSNYEVSTYKSAEDFLSRKEKCAKRGLYLVDWNLPGKSGVDIVGEIRESDRISPVFMMSAYNRTDKIVEGLKRGADDYITKPFHFGELLARIENAHTKLKIVENDDFEKGIKVLPEAYAFLRDGQSYSLTKREFIIFEKLFNQLENPASRDELLECFDKEEKITIRNIDVHIFSLRKKLKLAHIVIETVWGLGYKLIVTPLEKI